VSDLAVQLSVYGNLPKSGWLAFIYGGLTLLASRAFRTIARVGYPEAGESPIRRITRRLLVRFHNQQPNQLVRGVSESLASNRTRWDGFCSVRNVFDLLRHIARLYVNRIPNRIACPLRLQFRNSPIYFVIFS
jgi:hypothetical protein